MTKEQRKAEAELCMRRALGHIQQAQNELGRACSELAKLCNGAGAWKRVGKAYDVVHKVWYAVEAVRMKGECEIDGLTEQALEHEVVRG